MNIEQCKDLLVHLKNAIVTSPPQRENELCTWVYYKDVQSVKFKRWRLRYIPGAAFIFNGKQRTQHQISFPRYGNDVYGVFYQNGGYFYSTNRYFFYPKEEIYSIFRRENKMYLLGGYRYDAQSIIAFSDSDEELKNTFCSKLTADLEESLEIINDDDLEKFKRYVDLVSIRNL